MTLIYCICPREVTEGNMSATVRENGRNSGEIEHDVGNSRVKIVIHNSV